MNQILEIMEESNKILNKIKQTNNIKNYRLINSLRYNYNKKSLLHLSLKILCPCHWQDINFLFNDLYLVLYIMKITIDNILTFIKNKQKLIMSQKKEQKLKTIFKRC